MTALLWAAHIGDREGIRRLLSFGADVDRQLKVCRCLQGQMCGVCLRF